MHVDGVVQVVGRDPEFRHVRAAMAHVRQGNAAVTVVEGEPGIGKTRFVREIERMARDEGWVVIEFRCSELDADRPFEAVASGLEELCTELGEATPFEIGEAVRVLRHGASEGSANGDHVTTLVLEGLRELCRTHACAVVFDDAHWIDEASVQVLWGLARRNHNTTMMTLATFRPSTEPRVVTLRRGLDGQGAATLALSPLSLADGESIATSMLGAPPTDGVRELLRVAGGNPLFITELLRGRRELAGIFDETVEGEVTVPPSLRGLVERRLASLPTAVRDVLGDAALLGMRIDLDELATLVDVSVRDVVALLHPATLLRVLVDDGEGLSFQHAVVQKIVADSQPALVRRRRHREVAERLAAIGRPATRVAEHFWLSGRRPDATAAEWMTRAALEVRSLSVAAALTWLERARDCADALDQFSVTLDIATVLILLNRAIEAEAVCRTSAAQPVTPADQIRLHEVLAAIASIGGPARVDEAAGHLEAIVALFDENDPRRIEPLGWRAVLSMFTGQLDEAKRIAESALRIAFTEDEKHFRSQAFEALSVTALLEGDIGLAQQHGAEAMAIHRDRSERFSTLMMMTPHFTYSMSLLATEPIGRIMDVLYEGFQVCDRAGHLLARLHLEPLMATAHFVRGDIVHANALVARTLERNSYATTGVPMPTSSAIGAYIALLFDDVPRATAMAESALNELLAGGSQAGTAEFAVWCIAQVAEETGDVDRARDLLVAVWELVAKDASMYVIAPDLVRLTKDARPDFAADITDRCVARAARTGTPLDRAHAHSAKGWLHNDWAELRRGAAAWFELDWHFPATRMLRYGLPFAPALQRAEAQADVRAALVRMEAPRPLRLFDAEHAQPRARGRHHRPASGPQALSHAELAVVRLVGEGLTNKEIAERLFVSHRTVDSHVSHAFSKLGVNGRVALAGLVAKGFV